MNHAGRHVLLVTGVRPPERVALIRTLDDGNRAEVRWPSGGWMIVQTCALIDPPVDVLDRDAQLDVVVAQANVDADALTQADVWVLEAFDKARPDGLTSEQLAARLDDVLTVAPDVLQRAVHRHVNADRLTTAAAHRRTMRGRHAAVLHITALGRLGIRTATGRFGAEMQVELVNDGPFTIWLDTDPR